MTEASHLTVYVYYKIPTETHTLCLKAVKNLDQAMKSRYPFLKINHQKRPELDAENRELWMETYSGVPKMELDNFYAALSLLAEQNGLPKERKYEVFTSL